MVLSLPISPGQFLAWVKPLRVPTGQRTLVQLSSDPAPTLLTKTYPEPPLLLSRLQKRALQRKPIFYKSGI